MGRSDGVSERRAAAIWQVDQYFAGIPGAGRLPPRVMTLYRAQGYKLGWQLSREFSDGVRRCLHVVVDSDFPYTPPRIALADGPGLLAWPHLEEHGLLCVLPSDTAVSSQSPTSVLAYVLGEACRLIEESISGSNVEDFRQEFLSYWALAADDGAHGLISTLEPSGPGRKIAVWRGDKVRVVGESPKALKQWLSRWGAKSRRGGDYKLFDGVLIWLPKPLTPEEYPGAAAAVRTLARHHSTASLEVLDSLAVRRVDEIDVVLGARTVHGTCFGGVVVKRPRHPSGSKRKSDPLVDGFRPGRVPAELLVTRYFSRAPKAMKAIVRRADHLWVHGRDQDRRQKDLREARVAVLGCGSLGGPLARLLAQSGVGSLLLVDPANLDWPNVGRHALGARSVNWPKAHELAREIEEAYPHLADISWRNKAVGCGESALMDELLTYDLVVSTMGNWAAESFLNDLQQEREHFPPIIYGWLEPHAAAAHAVVVLGFGACLRCGVNDKGRPHYAVTDWLEGGDNPQAPACGAVYTPYGPAELGWAHALTAETVIASVLNKPATSHHRIWVGRRDRVAEAGGIWAENWIEEMGDPGTGGMTVERPWPQSASCPVCARRANAA